MPGPLSSNRIRYFPGLLRNSPIVIFTSVELTSIEFASASVKTISAGLS